MKPGLLISACLTGIECKYSGGSNALPDDILAALEEKYTLVPACPEEEGGLPVPRDPAERRGERVINKAGADVTREYTKGADIALKRAKDKLCAVALMKERSPSCGSGYIYDGSFSGTLIPGDGVAAAKLKAAGVRVYGESDVSALIK